jgi:hypothetical protein
MQMMKFWDVAAYWIRIVLSIIVALMRPNGIKKIKS